MKYLVQIVLSSNTSLDILTRDVIDVLHKSGFIQIELIKGISHFPDNKYETKLDTNILQFELAIPEASLHVPSYLHKLTNNKLCAYKIRIIELKYSV